MSGRNLGGQKRTTICACGFIAKGQLREANFRFKLHAKKCELAQEAGFTESAFNPLVNGMNGMTVSRNGNYQHRPVVATATTAPIEQPLTLSQAVQNIELRQFLEQLQNVVIIED